MCNHLFVEGFSGTGGLVVCEHCGLTVYPEKEQLAVLFAKLQKRFIAEDHPDHKAHFNRALRTRYARLDEESE